jgi:alkanesulfonate monooxygenase SsuD/methylene tetrahydromethanopterin reductase-like flavin-dependent oxidoreductase (luciferase family)
MRQVFIAETDAEALSIAELAYHDWYESITELWHKNNDASFDALFAWEESLSSGAALIGSASTVRERIQQLVEDSGINYFAGSFAWGSLTFEQSRDSLTRFISEIIPYIQPSGLE